MSLGKASSRGHSEAYTTLSTETRRRGRNAWERILICLLILTATVAPYGTRRYFSHLLQTSPQRTSPANTNPAHLIKAKHAAVASEHGLCSNLGVQILKDGGNAVDSAVGTTFCIGVVNMFSSGIGGGGFMTVRLPPSAQGGTSEVWSIDFRETAPALANSTMYKGRQADSQFGGLSVGVPGEVRGLAEVHKRWGKLPWKRLVQPSAEIAAGWTVGKELALKMHLPEYRSLFLHNPDWSHVFAPNGVLLKEGDTIQHLNLSRTLSVIAEQGPDAFYRGEIADAIIGKIRAEGGILSHEDLANYEVKVSRALEGTYRGQKIYTTHAPTSGPVLLHMLNLMEKYDLTGEGRTDVNVHRLIEATKFGFAARTRICDPAFNDDPDRIDNIPLKSYGASISKNITDNRTHPPLYYQPIFDVPEDHGTSHTSIVDENGMAVAITSTVNFAFGSQVMDPVTGILFNDEMEDFSIPGVPNGIGLWPSPYNYPEAQKRPLSSTVPTIVENSDGSFYLALGGSGGSHILSATFQVILNLDWGLDIGSAIKYGRLHHQLYPEWVEADDVYPSDLLLGLQKRGHTIRVVDVNRLSSTSAVNAVMLKDGTVYAASDSRKYGIAAGY